MPLALSPWLIWPDQFYAPIYLSSYARGVPRHVAGFDLGGAISGVVDAAGDVVNAAAGVVGSIPGVSAAVQFFGSELQDFANTTIGQIALDMLASYVFPEVAMVVGPQLASVVFAGPGLAKGEGFVQAWLTDFMKRLEQLADIEGADVAGAIAGQLEPALAQLEQLAQQAGIDPTQYATQLESYTSDQVHKLAQQLGVRDDMLQSAIDYLSGQMTIAVDAATRAAEQKAWDALRAALPGLPTSYPGSNGTKTFDPSTGNFTNPPLLSVLMSSSLSRAARSNLPAVSSGVPLRKTVLLTGVAHPAAIAAVKSIAVKAQQGDPVSQQTVAALDQAYRSVSRMQWVNHYVFGADIPTLLPPPTPASSPAPQSLPGVALPTAQNPNSPMAKVAALHASSKPVAPKTIAFHGTLPAPSPAPGMNAQGLLNVIR